MKRSREPGLIFTMASWNVAWVRQFKAGNCCQRTEAVENLANLDFPSQ
jgi:hypothetical protein